MAKPDSVRSTAALLSEGACAYCAGREAHGKTLHWTGRRWLCSGCWRDVFGEDHPETRATDA